MANFQPVINQKTNKASGLYFYNGSYYKYDPAQGYVQTNETPQTIASTSAGAKGPGGIAESIGQYSNTIHGINPQEYGGNFGQAYTNLGQEPTGHEAIVYNGVLSLANAFVNRFTEKTGKVPTEDQVKSFVASTATPGFAAKVITGIGNDQINAQYVDPYIQDNGLGSGSGDAQSRILGLNDELDKAYESGKSKFLEDTEANYGAQKKGLADDLAGQGMLTNPNSRVSLDALEANKNKNVASGLTTLAGERAKESVDLGKTIESLLQGQQQINNQSSQFNKTFNAGREDTFYNQGLQNRQLSLADTLGKLQAESRKPGTLDYLGTAFGGLSALGSAATGAAAAKTAFK